MPPASRRDRLLQLLPATPSGPRGMTIVEVMIALVIVAILTAISYPTISDSFAEGELRTTVNETKFLLSEARARAAERNVAVGVLMDVGGPMGGSLEIREAIDRDCTGVDNLEPALITLDLTEERFGNTGFVSVSMDGTDQGAQMDLCFRPDGGVFVRPAGTPITGAVQLFFRRYKAGAPEGVERIIRMNFNGIPRIER